MSLFSNSPTAVVHNHQLDSTQSTSSHFAISFQSAFREVNIDQACSESKMAASSASAVEQAPSSQTKPFVLSSADDSGVGLSFSAPDTSSFDSGSILSLDEVLAEEVKQAMVELDLQEQDQTAKKKSAERRKKMLVAQNYTADEKEEISVRVGEIVSVVHEDRDWLLVETDDLRFGFVPRDCCMLPYSVMFSDTAATCTGSVACLSVLSEDELISHATSCASTLDRRLRSRELSMAGSATHLAAGSLRGCQGCLHHSGRGGGKENCGMLSTFSISTLSFSLASSFPFSFLLPLLSSHQSSPFLPCEVPCAFVSLLLRFFTLHQGSRDGGYLIRSAISPPEIVMDTSQ